MRVAKLICLLALLAPGIGIISLHGTESTDKPLVGNLREFDKFDFQGNATFSARKLWFALNSTFDFPELSHPLASRDKFLSAIASHLKLGYEHSGFPDANVKAAYDAKADQVLVQIKEGTRYFCGPVEITGATHIPTRPIIKALTVTNSESDALPLPFQFLDNAPANRIKTTETNNSCIWVKGTPAHFDDFSLQFLSQQVTNTLVNHGFYLSQFSLHVVTNAATRTATLHVNISNEGPPATIDHILVVGNLRNSREEIVNHLGLKPGMKITRNLVASINNNLYHSARFLTNSVHLDLPDSDGRVNLTIDVAENDKCPPLAEPFKPTDKALLKARDWLANLGNTRNEMVMSVSGLDDKSTTVNCILAPRQGLLIQESATVSGTNQLRHALILSANQTALYVPERRQKYVTHLSPGQFKSFITIETEAPNENGNTGNLSVGAGTASLKDVTNAPPYALSMSLAPAAFVRQAYVTNYSHWFAGHMLILSNASFVLNLDAQTGKFIRLTSHEGESNHVKMNLHFEAGAFNSALTRIENEGAVFTNVCQTNAPLGSAIAFFGSELVQLPIVNSFLQTKLPAATCSALPDILRELENVDYLSPFELFKNFSGKTNDATENFEIPQQPVLRIAKGGLIQTELALGAQLSFAGGDLVFPPNSWPWIIFREAGFAVRGQTKYLNQDLAEIYHSSKTGPIGCLASACFLKYLGSAASVSMARQGVKRLSADDFRSDYHILLDPHYFSGQFAARWAATLADLNASQLNTLTKPMDVESAKFFRNCAQRLRTAPKGQPLAETIAPALDAYWENALRRSVAVQLNKFAGE